MITANNFIYTFLGLTDPVPVEYVTTSGFPFVPEGKKLTIAVRPISSLGTKGKTIGTAWRV